MTKPIHILLQTTIAYTENDWHIGRFSMLRDYLSSLMSTEGRSLFRVTARDRDPVGADGLGDDRREVHGRVVGGGGPGHQPVQPGQHDPGRAARLVGRSPAGLQAVAGSRSERPVQGLVGHRDVRRQETRSPPTKALASYGTPSGVARRRPRLGAHHASKGRLPLHGLSAVQSQNSTLRDEACGYLQPSNSRGFRPLGSVAGIKVHRFSLRALLSSSPVFTNCVTSASSDSVKSMPPFNSRSRRLNTGLIGPWGNTWRSAATPAFAAL